MHLVSHPLLIHGLYGAKLRASRLRPLMPRDPRTLGLSTDFTHKVNQEECGTPFDGHVNVRSAVAASHIQNNLILRKRIGLVRSPSRFASGGVQADDALCLFLAHLTKLQRYNCDADASSGVAESFLDTSMFPVARSLVGFKIVVLPCALPPSAELLELDLGADVPSLFVKYWKRVWQRGRNTGWAPRWLHHEH